MIEKSKKFLEENGFIPLIEYERKYNDRLLISFPSSKYRKGNVIAKINNNGTIHFQVIENIKRDLLTNYRISIYKKE